MKYKKTDENIHFFSLFELNTAISIFKKLENILGFGI